MSSNPQTVKSPVVHIEDFGADPTGTNDSASEIQDAIDAAPNGATIVSGIGVYALSSSADVDGKQLDFVGAGAGNTIWYATAAGGALRYGVNGWVDWSANTWMEAFTGGGSMDFRPKVVTEIENMLQENTPFPYDSNFAGNSLAFSLRIESATLVSAGVRAGDQVKLVSDDIEHREDMSAGSYTGSSYRYGRYFTVLGVDGNDVFFTNTTPYMHWDGSSAQRGLPLVGSALRAAIVPRWSPTIRDIGFRGDVEGGNALVRLESLTQPRVRDIAIWEAGGRGLRLRSTVGASVTGSMFNNCSNDPDSNALGVGVLENSTKSTRISDCGMRFVRVGWASHPNNVAAGTADISLFGQCEDFRVSNCTVTASAVAGYDIGPLSSGQLVNCTSQDDYTGDLGGDSGLGGGGEPLGGVGFLIRSQRIKLFGCRVHNSRLPFLITGQVHRQTGNVGLYDCHADASPHRALWVTTQGDPAEPIGDVHVDGGFYETDGFTEAVTFDASTKVRLTGGVRIRNRNGLFANGSKCLVVNGGEVWLSDVVLEIVFNNSVTGTALSGMAVADGALCLYATGGALVRGNNIFGDWDHDDDPDVTHFFAGGDGTDRYQIDGIHWSSRSSGPTGFQISVRSVAPNEPAAAPLSKFGYWDPHAAVGASRVVI